MTVLADPVRQRNVGPIENIEKPDWAKHMAKTMAQIQMMMKELLGEMTKMFREK